VYQILNTLTGDKYIGSSVNLRNPQGKGNHQGDGAVTTAETEIQSLTDAYQAKLAEIDAL